MESELNEYFSQSNYSSMGIMVQYLSGNRDEVVELYRSVNSAVSSLHEAFISKYTALIEEISQLSSDNARRIKYISLGFLSIILLFVMGFMILIIRSINTEINKIEVGVYKMKEKELTDRIEINSNSELAVLGKEVNDFTDFLGQSLKDIKNSSEENLGIKESLIDMVTETSSASVQMKQNSLSIMDDVKALNRNISSSTRSNSDNLKKIEIPFQ